MPVLRPQTCFVRFPASDCSPNLSVGSRVRRGRHRRATQSLAPRSTTRGTDIDRLRPTGYGDAESPKHEAA